MPKKSLRQKLIEYNRIFHKIGSKGCALGIYRENDKEIIKSKYEFGDGIFTFSSMNVNYTNWHYKAKKNNNNS